MKTYSHLEQKMVKEFAEILVSRDNLISEDVWTNPEIEVWLRSSLRTMAEAAADATQVRPERASDIIADQDQKRREFFV